MIITPATNSSFSGHLSQQKRRKRTSFALGAIFCAITLQTAFAQSLFNGANIGGAANSGNAPPLSEVLQAAQQTTEVLLARQATVGAQADVLTADHAPLPTLSGKFSQIDLQNGLGPGNVIYGKRVDTSIGLDWTYERGDKRAHRTRTAERTVAATMLEREETALQQMLSAEAVYFDWLAAREKVILATHMEDAAKEAVRVAGIRLKAGDLSEQDASRIEIDAARVAADRQSAQLDLTRASITLNQILRRNDLQALAKQTPVIWPALTAPSLPPQKVAADNDASLDQRADVRAARARISAAMASVDSANALSKVDPTWGISYDRFPGTSNKLVELRVQIPLTWGYKYQGESARAYSDLKQAELVEERIRRDAKSELERLREEALAAQIRMDKFETEIVPKATRVAEQADFAYRRGASSLTDLLDARRTLRATQQDALAAKADLAKARTAYIIRTTPELLLR